jgi:hypothetical protein
MRAWIQKHDLSAEEFDAPDASSAKRAFHGFDWAAECQRQAQSSGETCDPGFGLVVGDGHILHVCPDPKGACVVYLHYPSRGKLFGLLPKTVQQTRTWNAVSVEEADRMIDSMFLGHFDALTARA